MVFCVPYSFVFSSTQQNLNVRQFWIRTRVKETCWAHKSSNECSRAALAPWRHLQDFTFGIERLLDERIRGHDSVLGTFHLFWIGKHPHPKQTSDRSSHLCHVQRVCKYEISGFGITEKDFHYFSFVWLESWRMFGVTWESDNGTRLRLNKKNNQIKLGMRIRILIIGPELWP